MKREPRLARRLQNDSSIEDSAPIRLARRSNSKSSPYAKFTDLDGSHPYREAVPEGYIEYPVQNIDGGKISYFNFDLAKEMGLLPTSHPNQMNKELERILLDTFAIRIVNEYDQKKGRGIKPESIKTNKFMATRYLQLQHNDKKGRTSGDGRSIWNGVISHAGNVWDVSSRGTGVTRLAPGAVEAGKPLRTGGTEFGYGCGLADIDELYGTAVMSEIFHRQGIPTERVLCIVDTGKKQGIGVRAHRNLLRPAHVFMYLKQGDYKNLRRVVNYLIDRQVKNRQWAIASKGSTRYDEMCIYLARSFAQLTARLDVEYIFVWLDWDGDNILADGSIIDYGSVRQFGLRHDQYRYDDVDRYSTNLNEQRRKAREIVQAFAQAADFLKTGKKQPIEKFSSSPVLALFDQVFEEEKNKQLLYRVGFNKKDQSKVLSRYFDQFDSFKDAFHYFEKQKTSKGTEKVADGVNRPAIFNMRDLLRELPKLLANNKAQPVAPEVLFNVMLSTIANKRDSFMSIKQGLLLQDLQSLYLDMIDKVRGRRSRERMLRELAARSAVINKSDRITGNAVTVVVDEIMEATEKGLSTSHIQTVVDAFVHTQVLVPEVYNPDAAELKKVPHRSRQLMKTLLKVVDEHREDI